VQGRNDYLETLVNNTSVQMTLCELSRKVMLRVRDLGAITTPDFYHMNGEQIKT